MHALTLRSDSQLQNMLNVPTNIRPKTISYPSVGNLFFFETNCNNFGNYEDFESKDAIDTVLLRFTKDSTLYSINVQNIEYFKNH